MKHLKFNRSPKQASSLRRKETKNIRIDIINLWQHSILLWLIVTINWCPPPQMNEK